MSEQGVRALVFAPMEVMGWKPPHPPDSPEMQACRQLYLRHLAGYSEARLRAGMDELIRGWKWPRWPTIAEIREVMEGCDWADHKPLPASRRVEHQEPVEREYSEAERADLDARAEALMAKLRGDLINKATGSIVERAKRKASAEFRNVGAEARALDLPKVPGR